MTLGWLLDTNIVSELFKGPRADRDVQAWIDQCDEDRLYLSTITLGEIAKGIGLAEQVGRDMSRQRVFLDQVLPETFSGRMLPFGREAAIIWGGIMQRLRGNREQERLLTVDAQIAATAEAASLTLCSRNVRDFARLGVSDIFNPFRT